MKKTLKKFNEFESKMLIESCGGGSNLSGCGSSNNTRVTSCGGSSSIRSCGGHGYTSPEPPSEIKRKKRNKKFNAILDENNCINCDTKLIEGAKFCHECGTEIE